MGSVKRATMLLLMAMLASRPLSAAFFIGGMEGVEQEYDLLVKHYPSVPRFPVYTTGGAAQMLWTRESDLAKTGARRQQLDHLRNKASYSALFTGILETIGG